jgi:hypothetical protein
MLQLISIYLLIGLIYTILLNWIFKNYSKSTIEFEFKYVVLNTLLWPLGMYLVYHAYKDKDE